MKNEVSYNVMSRRGLNWINIMMHDDGREAMLSLLVSDGIGSELADGYDQSAWRRSISWFCV